METRCKPSDKAGRAVSLVKQHSLHQGDAAQQSQAVQSCTFKLSTSVSTGPAGHSGKSLP